MREDVDHAEYRVENYLAEFVLVAEIGLLRRPVEPHGHHEPVEEYREYRVF